MKAGFDKTSVANGARLPLEKPATRSSLACHAPQAAIVFDKFHIIGHLSAALDQVRRSEYKRLNTAYMLKESFGQLRSYRTERAARVFFDRWKQRLRWQRLKPYQKSAQMIENHWDGIVSYCRPENKASLGMVEGLNNNTKVIQRTAYGYRDEEYLRLKIIASFLPPLPVAPD